MDVGHPQAYKHPGDDSRIGLSRDIPYTATLPQFVFRQCVYTHVASVYVFLFERVVR